MNLDLTIVVDNDEFSNPPSPTATATTTKQPKVNLRIEIENDKAVNNGDLVDELVLNENDDILLQQDDDQLQPGDIKQVQSDQNMEVEEGEEEETEFHVNLDKKPLTLEVKTSLVQEKLYINNSLENEKLDETITNKALNEENLKEIYTSLGINEISFEGKDDDSYRKEALHLYGVNELSTNEVFDYLNKFRPYAIEWINDYSCNVLWNNDHWAALALYEYTKPYVHQEVEKIKVEEVAEKEEGEIDTKTDKKENEDDDDVNSDDSDEIKSKFPPKTDKWRVGVEAKNGNLIYIRYAKRCDKKVPGAESRSKYYVKYGNPNFGHVKGLISNSKREQINQSRFNYKNRVDGDDDRTGSDSSDRVNSNRNKEIFKRISFPSKQKNGSDDDGSDDRKGGRISFSSKRKNHSDDDDSDGSSRRRDDRKSDKDSGKRKMGMYADEYDRSSKKIRENPVDSRIKHSDRNRDSGDYKRNDLRDRIKSRNSHHRY